MLRTKRKLAFYGIPNVVRAGAWHFSFIGDDDLIRAKIASHAHQEPNVLEMLKTIPDAIHVALEEGRFLRQTGSFRVEQLDALPMVVQREAKRFDHLDNHPELEIVFRRTVETAGSLAPVNRAARRPPREPQTRGL
jgi:hypothetical protein